MLFIDLDETLIKSFPNKILPKADLVFNIDGNHYSTFLRFDYQKIGKTPFVIFTASPCNYAIQISNFLKSKGLNIQGFMCRDHLKLSASRYPKTTGYLIDNSRIIAIAKLRKLPNVKWIKIAPFEFKAGKLQILDKHGVSLEKALEMAKKPIVLNPKPAIPKDKKAR